MPISNSQQHANAEMLPPKQNRHAQYAMKTHNQGPPISLAHFHHDQNAGQNHNEADKPVRKRIF